MSENKIGEGSCDDDDECGEGLNKLISIRRSRYKKKNKN